MMHFQDEYTYDIARVEKCDIHYSLPDGRVIPFCTFNVFPEIYRDKVQRQYAIPSKEWQSAHPGWSYAADKYKRNIKELEANPLYAKTYNNLTDFFSLPINRVVAMQAKANVSDVER
jgi:Predicted Fe-S oxidoreductases